MDFVKYSRRRLLRQATFATSLTALGGALPATTGLAQESAPEKRLPSGHLNVRDFGAIGDGKTDDTAAFTAAIGGNTVFIPPGRYLIKDTLDVPGNVVLEGVFRAPTARTQKGGSTLLAGAGAGMADAKPFITLQQTRRATAAR